MARAASYLVIFVMASVYIRKMIHSGFQLRKYFSILVCGIIFVLIVNYLKNSFDLPVVSELLLVMGLSLLAYIALILAFRVYTIKDIAAFRRRVFR